MFTCSKLQENREIYNKFIQYRDIDPAYKVQFGTSVFGYIYCIENIKTHKKYIGSTYSTWADTPNKTMVATLKKRASQYIYEYNSIRNNTGKVCYIRPIIKALVDEGIENFIMYPIAETVQSNHEKAEEYFINLYDAIKAGYNTSGNTGASHKTGTPHTAEGKRIRSTGIVCINNVEKKVIVSGSMKLFADYVNSTKDMIKNVNRRASAYKNWYVFYIDKTRRYDILERYIISKPNRPSEIRSLYTKLFNSVDEFIQDEFNPKYFPDFQILDPLIYKEE